MLKFSILNSQSSIKRGFTLLETLVAIAVLSLALAGVLSLSSIGIRSSSGASNQIKAFFLASEGVEYVRNKRDANILAGSNWISGLNGCEGGCYVDVYAPGGIVHCSGACPKLRFDAFSNRFDYDPDSQETIFTRKIIIVPINSQEISLSSEVSWVQGGITRGFSLEEHLFDLSF
ncbi:MAG: type II secretion system protein [Candidatus Niyogibacteria bacterium]|nr:MAG: type II secretion system protein [Candidatus Niyogibacteria bacterium]